MTFFSVKPKYNSASEFNKLGNISEMDTKDLLVQAHYFMDQHCVAEAVKCMIQLQGLPRRLAHDWIEEARLYLEVKQVSDALQSYATAKTLSHIF